MFGGGYCPGGTGPGGGYGAPGGQEDPGGGKGAGAPGGREGYIPEGGGPNGTLEVDVLEGNPVGAVGGLFQGLEAGQACGGWPGC